MIFFGSQILSTWSSFFHFIFIAEVILLTAMEHLREDNIENDEAPTKTSSSGEVETTVFAWPEAKTGNWSQHIRTFGERKTNPERLSKVPSLHLGHEELFGH